MKKIILFLFVISMLSCNKEDIEMNYPSTFPNLKGEYIYRSYETSTGTSTGKTPFYGSWNFDNTTKAFRFYASDFDYKAYKFTKLDSCHVEWKVENDKLYERVWGNKSSEWKSHEFEYLSSRSFRLDGNLYEK